MTFSDWNLVSCRTPHDPAQLSSQRLLLQGPLFSKQALAQIAKSGGLRFHSERFFQIIPIKTKRAISVRKAKLMMETVRIRRSPIGSSCLASCEAPKPNSPRLEKFRFQQTARDASGATQISQRAWLELCSHQPMLKSDWVSHGLGQSRSGASRQQVKPGAQRPESGIPEHNGSARP